MLTAIINIVLNKQFNIHFILEVNAWNDCIVQCMLSPAVFIYMLIEVIMS